MAPARPDPDLKNREYFQSLSDAKTPTRAVGLSVGFHGLLFLMLILVPLLAPSLIASFVLLFIIGFREFTIPAILQSRENLVLSVIMWQLFQGAKTAQAAAVGTVIVLLVVPIIFALRRIVLAGDGRD